MPANTLKELFIEQLHDMYDAEQRLTKALPKLAKAASSDDLVAAIESHLEETREHVSRLEQVFETLDESPKRKTCKAMVGLLEEGQEIMGEEMPSNVKDAALIAAAQKVEHYEMATYGCLRSWAELLDETQASKLLQKTLDEEAAADQKLTDIAQSLNPDAMEGESEEDEEEMASSRHSSGSGNRSSSKSRSR